MLQQFKFGQWLLEIDPDKTSTFYERDLDVCDCLYCENYAEATKKFKPSISDLFNALGISPVKPALLSEFDSEEIGTNLYQGHYHFVGKVIEGELCTDSNFSELNTIQLENFKLGFRKELSFVPEGFPSPVLELSFEAIMPWVLKNHPTDSV